MFIARITCVTVVYALRNDAYLSISLDRDSAAWKLSDKAVQRRRNLFWELFSLEMIHVRTML